MTAESAPIPSESPPADARRTIALVDDDRNILTTLSIALQAEGNDPRFIRDWIDGRYLNMEAGATEQHVIPGESSLCIR